MKRKTCVLCCLAAWLAGPVCVLAAERDTPPPTPTATQALAAYLPAELAAREALLSSPWMQAARAEKEGWSARAKATGAGPHEFTVRSTSQRRQDVANGTRWHESMVSVETPLRFWGKRGLDSDLEDTTQAYAELGYADAMHEGGRELIQLWFTYLNALATEQNASTALELAAKMQHLTQVQLKHGEVSKLDAELASAEHERTQAPWPWPKRSVPVRRQCCNDVSRP